MEVSKHGHDMLRCVKELTATEPWPAVGRDWSQQETSWEAETLFS